MYGLPGQTPAGFRAGLERAVALPVEHLSVYGLKVEEGTPFARLAAEGRLALDEEAEEAMYDEAVAFLPAHGFARYEISNYQGREPSAATTSSTGATSLMSAWGRQPTPSCMGSGRPIPPMWAIISPA
jgi:coproporphyrinogen III oxidase-like Fe-S oxidoreductase